MRFVSICATALLAVAPAAAQDWQQSFHVGGQPRLEVHAAEASLNIMAGGPGSIDGRFTVKDARSSARQVKVEAEQHGDTVILRIKYNNSKGHWLQLHHSERLDVTVPANTSLDLQTSDGTIHATGIHATAQLTTADGSIHVEGFDGDLHARTSDGSITVAGRFDVLDLHTSDGSITADAQHGSRISGDWTLHTSDGAIHLRIPATVSADVNASTSDGHLTFDLPITVQGEWSKHKLHGRLNGGGHLLDLRTSDGSIEIYKS